MLRPPALDRRSHWGGFAAVIAAAPELPVELKGTKMHHKRVVVTCYGGPEVITVIEEDVPARKAGEVRVKVSMANYRIGRKRSEVTWSNNVTEGVAG